MKIKDILFDLSALDSIGSITAVQDYVSNFLSQYCSYKKTDNNNIIAYLNGKSDYTVMLDAHIDQVGFVVTNVDDNGFLTVSNVGGIDIRALPSRAVTVHGKQKITAVFCATPPHLASGEKEYSDLADIKLDTALGEKAKDIVSIGDYVTFSSLPFQMGEDIVCGRSFDDRAGVVCLLETVHRLSSKELPVNVIFSFSTAEELGLRGVRSTAFSENITEAVAVDVTFGDGVGLSSEESCKLGEGAMIGVSPTLDKALSQRLTKIARDNSIPHDLEIMAGTTGTNADMISISKSGVKTATVSIPLRNMHTDCEILNLTDVSAVCDLLENYVLSGGVLGD